MADLGRRLYFVILKCPIMPTVISSTFNAIFTNCRLKTELDKSSLELWVNSLC